MRILVVDDEPKIRRGLKMLIKHIDSSYEVETADDGDTALTIVRSFTPSIVFVDIKMPTMNGLTFIKEAQAIDKEIGFIVVSGYAQFEYAREAMEYGVINYILKPIMPAKIEEVLAKAVEYVRQKAHDDQNRIRLREHNLISSIYTDNPMTDIRNTLAIDSRFIVVVGIYGRDKGSEYNYTISQKKKLFIKGMISSILNQYGETTVAFRDNELVAIVSLSCMSQLKTCRFMKEEIKNIGYDYISLGVSSIGNLESAMDIKSAHNECLQDMGVNDDIFITHNVSGIVLKIITYIKEHYMHKIKLSEIADHVYMHPTNVSKIFKKEAGMNLTDYIIQYRIKKSKELLCNPAYKIYDVAESVGFNGSKYFINVFKAKTGMTPNEFRIKNIK